jgi:hypothetical protein
MVPPPFPPHPHTVCTRQGAPWRGNHMHPVAMWPPPLFACGGVQTGSMREWEWVPPLTPPFTLPPCTCIGSAQMEAAQPKGDTQTGGAPLHPMHGYALSRACGALPLTSLWREMRALGHMCLRPCATLCVPDPSHVSPTLCHPT